MDLTTGTDVAAASALHNFRKCTHANWKVISPGSRQKSVMVCLHSRAGEMCDLFRFRQKKASASSFCVRSLAIIEEAQKFDVLKQAHSGRKHLKSGRNMKVFLYRYY